MEDFIITQAVSAILLMLKDKKKAAKWKPAIRKIRDAAIAIVGTK